ncbi:MULTISPECIES: CDP-glycerol glycerophosphotransferase family protein [Vibrio]|uniref:CDP-glycerol glycerophosphotransferase family protein n=1 Tax=Vibrio TaxID=662 RepID=UPI0020C1B326|nr:MULTISPECIES: CDP-glycerol glycerophosphotransferase family protein [Vibrio]MDW2326721.1 CDP-glycerol glycerophosphotransferase family protein [Vibrio sp. 1401]
MMLRALDVILLPFLLFIVLLLSLFRLRQSYCFYSPVGLNGSIKNLYSYYNFKGKITYELYSNNDFSTYVRNVICILRSKHVFLTHGVGGLPLILFSSVRIQLWHGIPLKKILLDNENDSKREKSLMFFILYKLRIYLSYNFLITGRGEASDVLVNSFGFPETKVKRVSGYISNYLLDVNDLRIARNKSDIAYLPTWRESDDATTNIFNLIYCKKLDNILGSYDKKLTIYPHPYDRDLYYHLEEKNPNFGKLKNIELSKESVNVGSYNKIITDYSSIAFEAMHYGVDVAFFCPDLMDYVSSGREMYDYFYKLHILTKIEDLEAYIVNKDPSDLENLEKIYTYNERPAEQIYELF